MTLEQTQAPDHKSSSAALPSGRECQKPGGESLGFLARLQVQATLPHRLPKAHVFHRSCGQLQLRMQAPAEVGLPYGSYPRLVILYLTTQALRQRSRHVDLGPSLSGFLKRLGLPKVSGKRGSGRRLGEQLHRLFATTLHYEVRGKESKENGSRQWELRWDPAGAENHGWRRQVTLSTDLFDQIRRHPVPLHLETIQALRGSPMALDIYSWLTFRMSYLCRPCSISWTSLQEQFGSDFERLPDFRRHFCTNLERVLRHYSSAQVKQTAEEIWLYPSPPHVRRSSVAR